MKQQTAVNFLISELELNKIVDRDKLTIVGEVLRQALEKEKEQIIRAAVWGFNAPSGEQYYNETYKQD